MVQLTISHQTTSHYLYQCWPRSLMWYDITRGDDFGLLLKSIQCHHTGRIEQTHWYYFFSFPHAEFLPKLHFHDSVQSCCWPDGRGLSQENVWSETHQGLSVVMIREGDKQWIKPTKYCYYRRLPRRPQNMKFRNKRAGGVYDSGFTGTIIMMDKCPDINRAYCKKISQVAVTFS